MCGFFLCRGVQCWIRLYGIFPHRFFLYGRRLFRLLQNGVLDGSELTVFVSDALTDHITVFLQLTHSGAYTIYAVLADMGETFCGVVPFLRQREHKGEQPLRFQGQSRVTQMMI